VRKNKAITAAGILILLFAQQGCSSQESNQAPQPEESVSLPGSKAEKAGQVLQNDYSAYVGETIEYSVKKIGIKAGEAVLKFEGPTDYQGKPYYVISFKVNAPTIADEEKIYADTQTFYPAFVERDVRYLGNHEKISEAYDQAKGEVKITKVADGKTEEQVIKKEGAIDNIYCFIYRQRKNGKFKVGESFSTKLPTLDLVINSVKLTTVSAGGKEYDAFYMQSVPAKYKLWFDTGELRIPLQINGAAGMGDVAMIMSKYSSKGK